ncbi:MULTISPECIES: pantoate--beta-alanine ligase [Legionella]|uniref:Pantothenate synthetase n=1 Tax=Legionella resiliens TaxID=2905958 RepID=A0ABS8WYK2_9GAMM|nr:MULTISPECIES: pantoate--beta-alanine ligase [unclassified Legionella]MCE0722389.1 pantoate--beta-alanine ligase [Legionella sp. 9fVS26]MCE3531543.1 pantoate--beta-alanine ligase [Legionella sp. 8cVS16]QLZ67562.1 pantoate--beta-alanine ligase [Legionella sp. PC1000]
MHIFHNLDEWLRFRKSLSTELTLGFAPTMGNLHAGHASLFLASQKETDHTVSSLFVNPTQFNQAEDFKHYPRTLEADLKIMEDCGVDFCILPDEKSIYADEYTYQVHERQLCQLMEGSHRPGHFNGVLTIVMKLLNLVKPHRAYFGEKDYQQYLLIQGMAKAFFMDVEIKACPTIREASGLAYSSRNNRLNKEQKALAEEFAAIFQQKVLTCDQIIKKLTEKGIGVEYVEEHQGRRFAAVRVNDIRLIDNYLLG